MRLVPVVLININTKDYKYATIYESGVSLVATLFSLHLTNKFAFLSRCEQATQYKAAKSIIRLLVPFGETKCTDQQLNLYFCH